MAIPIPEFKVLLYGPGLSPSGKRVQARFEGSVLTLIARDTLVMVAAQDLSLTTGGYDGHQWVISWVAQEGSYSALLQGDRALRAFIDLAPREIGLRLQRSRAAQTRKRGRLRSGLILLVWMLVLGLLWRYANHFSLWAFMHH